MDPVQAAAFDRRFKQMMERLDRAEARLAVLEAEAIEREAEADLPPSQKPWAAMGVSKATYYRRLKEASPNAQAEGADF